MKERKFDGPTNWLSNPTKPQVLNHLFKQKGLQPCELWKHSTMGVLYAIPLRHCPPINCEFICTSTITI